MAKKRSKNHRAHESGATAVPQPHVAAVPQPPAQSHAPAAPVPPTDEVRLLREALQAERSARAALELRLHSLEFELQQARRPKDAPAAGRLTPEDLGFATLHEAAAPAKPSADDYAFFESWVMEANMRADAELAAHAAPAAPSLIPVIAELAPSSADASIAQERLLRKLNSAREALETAEAKAAHNAAQVKKLTAELAAARADHMRATTRLRSLEVRLAQAEDAATPAAPGETLSEVQTPAAPVAAEQPFAEMDALPPLHPPVKKTETLHIEDALAAWGADLGDAQEPATPAPPAAGIEDALAAWGAADLGAAQEPATPAPPAAGIEDALAAWGAADPDAAQEPAAPAPPAAGIEDALAAWGALGEGIPTPPDSLTETPDNPFVDAPRAPVDSLPMLDVEDTPEDLEEEPAAARTQTPDPLADALANWGADTEPAPATQELALDFEAPGEDEPEDGLGAGAARDEEDEITFLKDADLAYDAPEAAPVPPTQEDDADLAARDLIFDDDASVAAPVEEITTEIAETAPAPEFVLDLDEVLPEDAIDIDFDPPATVDNLSNGEATQALEDALAEVFGEPEAEAEAEQQESAAQDDIEILDEDEARPDAPAPEPEAPAAAAREEEDFTPDSATPSLAAAYRNHHREGEREALLARPVRIMEAGQHHNAPKRSVAASLEGWSGFGEHTTRRAPARTAESPVTAPEETALDTAEDSGGKATMVDALLRFMRPK